MSSRFLVSLTVIAALTLAACEREEREARSRPLPETVPAGSSPGILYAGGPPPAQADARAAQC